MIEQIIKATLQELSSIAHEDKAAVAVMKQDSRLIFPKKRDESIRVSEQEVRFLLVRELELHKVDHGFYYSVETPTEGLYKFSEGGKIIDLKTGLGQSANIDLTLYKRKDDSGGGFVRKHLFEFKFGNENSHKKDFVKLLFDTNGLYNFYINIVDVESLKKRNTLKSVERKYQEAITEINSKREKEKLDNNSVLRIILYNVRDRNMMVYKDIDLASGKTGIAVMDALFL